MNPFVSQAVIGENFHHQLFTSYLSVIIKPADNRMSLIQRIHHIMKYKLQNNSPRNGNTNCLLRVWESDGASIMSSTSTYYTPHLCNKNENDFITLSRNQPWSICVHVNGNSTLIKIHVQQTSYHARHASLPGLK